MSGAMKYIYGPVESRRLGLSLGISLTPYKTCSFDCMYCQLGPTKETTVQIKDYLPIQEIAEEVRAWFVQNPEQTDTLKFITFSGAGEPTLHARFGELLAQIKKITAVPLAVITNASMLREPFVRQALISADVIVPSLDAVVPEVFAKIDRPHPDIKVEDIIQGLISLRREFRGKIWLEVMLVKGVNDDLRYIKKLQEVILDIRPDKIQLNSPVRTTADPDIFPVDQAKLEKIQEILGDKCEIV